MSSRLDNLEFISFLAEKKNKTLFITNKSSFNLLPIKDLIEDKFQGNFTRVTEFDLNPTAKDVLKLFQLYSIHEYQNFVGIGGGSAMDMAKILFYFSHFKSESINLDLILKELNLATLPKSTKYLGLIPTTCGSGSEATRFAVLYHEKEKYSLLSDTIVPQSVVLAGENLVSLPNKVLAFTTVDALVHAIEGFWSSSATQESQEYSIKALNLIAKELKTGLFNRDKVNYQNLIEASYFAGKSINISFTTAAHALSYYLTSFYNIPHGQAVYLCLIPILDQINSDIDLKPIIDAFKVKNIKDLKHLFYKYLNELNLEINFQEINLEEFSDKVNQDRLKNFPGKLPRKRILELFGNYQEACVG